MSSADRTRAPRKSPDARRAEIAHAARDLAHEHGLTALTLRAVAARIGVAPGLVAHYEPSMDALVARTFRAVVAAELDEVGALVAARPDPPARLAALLRTLLDSARSDVTVVWVEAWALGRRNEPLAHAVREEMDAWQSLIEGVVADGASSGAFRVADPAVTAWQVLGMIDGLNAQALVRWGDAGERGSLIEHAVEGMLGLERGTLEAASAA
ncbi:TetR/AcrR family transcriptional regulator [Agromyces sp. MMS24-JH15]|uniref:TetR/AcrR family transcriptional regulator n=1 Tax=Agromyces sp. MMS24-JH15 TaxID=3243765 RepID=UPI003748B58D